PSVGVYLLAYSVMVIGSFGVVAIASRSDDEATTLDSFRGFAARRPALAVAFTVFLLAQAGVPFTSGFIAKFGVIQAAVEERSYAIALIAMVASVIAAFLYLRIIVSMWMGDADADVGDVALAGAGRSRTWSGSMAIGLAALFTIAIGVVPGWLLEAADSITGYASR
nr:NADH-quinone oxidoreductase subunit N [Actinomycetota bacterium]